MNREESKERPPFVLSQRMGIFVVAVILVIVFLPAGFSLYLIKLLGLSGESAMSFVRFECIFILGVDAVPVAVLAEYVGSRTLKRSFRWSEIGVLIFAVAEFVLLMSAFLTISDVFLGGVEKLLQFPIVAVNFAVVLILWAYSTKIPAIHRRLESMLR
jgi:hypothetical protein